MKNQQIAVCEALNILYTRKMVADEDVVEA